MFLDEARLSPLHHQYIAPVYDVGRDDDGRYYLVMDYIRGESAEVVWERAVAYDMLLPLGFGMTIVSAIASALHYAHERRSSDGTPLGIVHRDVTPSNVMIGYYGAIKLIDFGIARAASRSSVTVGAPGRMGYLSPGQSTASRSTGAPTHRARHRSTSSRRWRAFRGVSDLSFDGAHRAATSAAVGSQRELSARSGRS
jgi:serine/threonine protein kinase